MDELEEHLKDLFGREAAQQAKGGHPRKGCLSEFDIHRYLEGQMDAKNRDKLEQHLVDCYECLGKVAEASKAKTLFEKGRLPKPPREPARWLKLLRPHLPSPKEKAPPRSRRPWGWLIATLIAFICSFLYPRYFVQFSIATLLCGIKWIVETRSTKILIAIHDAYKRGDRQAAEELLEKLGKRK